MTEKNATTVKPLFATVGATDAVYNAVLDAVSQARGHATDVNGRVDEARERFATLPADAQTQFEQIRARLSDLPSDLPDDLAELREKFTADELRKLAEQYYRQALDLYADLAVRGEETVDRLRANHLVEEQFGRVENLYRDASGRAEGVLERVNDLIGRSDRADVVDTAPVVEADTALAPVEEPPIEAEAIELVPSAAPAPVVPVAESVTPAAESAPASGEKAPAPAEKAPTPAEKAPVAKKAPAKKSTAAKKAPAKKAAPKDL